MRADRPAIDGHWPFNPLKMAGNGTAGIGLPRYSEVPLIAA
jgi:hypothetical protein